MKKFISIFILLLVAAFVAFNFYATRQAKKHINKFVQLKINSAQVPFTVNYSKVKVPVFHGKISFSDVTFKKSPTIIQIDHLQINLGYFNLFRFYVSRAETALKHISSARIHIKHLQYTDIKTHKEYSVHSATIHQDGNLWDAVRAELQKSPPQQRHVLDLTAAQLRYVNLGGSFGTFKSDSAHLHYIIPGMMQGTPQPRDSLQFRGITWILPAAYQNKFGTFLKGFGLSSDSIGVSQAGFSFSGLNREQIKIKNGIFKAKPFTLYFNGLILKRIPWRVSELSPLTIKAVRISDQLKTFLTNFGFLNEQGQKNPKQLSFRLVGPIDSPQLQKTNSSP